jgi:hypothetical protein
MEAEMAENEMAPTLPSVEEMKARLAELVEQHGEGSEPVVAYQAQLDAHPDNGPTGTDPNLPKSDEGSQAAGTSTAGIPSDQVFEAADAPAAEVETAVEDPPAEASQE